MATVTSQPSQPASPPPSGPGELILKVKQLRESSWFWWIVLVPVAVLVTYVLYQWASDAQRLARLANELEEARRAKKRAEEAAAQAAIAEKQAEERAKVEENKRKIAVVKADLVKEKERHAATVSTIRNLDPSDTTGLLAAWERAATAIESED